MSPSATQQLTIRLEARQRGEFRRFVWMSLALHVVAAVAVMVTPTGSGVAPPRGVQVRLIAPPAASKPRPATPRATPAPKPKPKPPKPAPVVLPTQPSEPRVRAKPRPKPPEPAPTPPREEEYTDVMDQLRAELGEETPAAETPETAPAAAPQAGSPDGLPVSPEVAAWLRKAKAHVRRNWVVPPAFEMQSLVTTIAVDLDAGGNVRGTPRVENRSGNPWYDENVVRSIQKASPFPPPPSARRWTFVFYSDRD